MNRIRFYLTAILFVFPGLLLQAENNVTLFGNNKQGQIQFAIGEISVALNKRGQSSVSRPISEINQLKSNEYSIILLNISDKDGSLHIKGLEVDNIDDLKNEGFLIHRSENQDKIIWIMAKDDAGLMYGGLILEAEDAEYDQANVKNNIKGYTGEGYLTKQSGHSINPVKWNYSAPEEGSYFLEFRYTLERQEEFLSLLIINGKKVEEIVFWETGNGGTWVWIRFTVDLEKGENAIEISPEGYVAGPFEQCKKLNI